ncbi:Glycosyltransferase involved in cell wall bisynthesis [Ectothiorhodospira marina]|uniref:Glycosyltransferase involved in cell wall bisynthesis n=2 Tax=Ectothiorhodospira marina TaxID=1396821 RepID=A0A1H7H8Z3_9GAMM|nr:Glycosyltransferase involved in cell wall bisynthesis [Ectothiorhodospira marina]
MTAPCLEGGGGRNLLNLCIGFIDEGYRVDIIVDHFGGRYIDQFPDGVRFWTPRGSHPIFDVPWLAWYLINRRPLAVLTAVPRHAVWMCRARSVSGHQFRLVVNVHNDYIESFKHLQFKKRQRRIRTIQRYYPRCDAVVPVSQGAARSFSNLSGIQESRLSVINNPVVTQDLEDAGRCPVDHPWFKDQVVPVIVWVGRMEPQKDLNTLLESFLTLRGRLGCRLALIGDGADSEKIKSKSKGSNYSGGITFLGYQANPFPFMKMASLLALSSRWEGFGNVLVEAMALGTPVVATNCPSGPAEILEYGRLGPIVPVGDVPALANAFERCIESPTDSSVLRQAAMKYAVNAVTKQYIRVLSA